MDSIIKYAMEKAALRVKFRPNAQGKAGPMAQYAQQHPERFQSYVKSLGDSKDNMMVQGARSQDPAVRRQAAATFRKGLFAHRTPQEQMRVGSAPQQQATRPQLRTGIGRTASARRAQLGTSTGGQVVQGAKNIASRAGSAYDAAGAKAYNMAGSAARGIRTGANKAMGAASDAGNRIAQGAQTIWNDPMARGALYGGGGMYLGSQLEEHAPDWAGGGGLLGTQGLLGGGLIGSTTEGTQ